MKFVGPSDQAGRKSQGQAILPSMLVRVSEKIFGCVFCFAPEIGNATGMLERSRSSSGQLELDSASNDIYFLNMQLFPW